MTAPTITARTNGSNGTSTGQGTFTSASFTPTASSKLYVFVQANGENNPAPTVRAWSASGGSLSYTKLAEPVTRAWTSAGGYDGNCAIFEADVGASPSSMTVTVDPDTGSANAFYMSWAIFDVSGGTITHTQTIQSASAQNGNGNSETLAVALGSSATNGNLSVACFGVFGTGGGAASTPAGWTQLVGQTQTYTWVSVWYRTDFTSTTVTCSDLGDAVGTSAATIMELQLPGGAAFIAAPRKPISQAIWRASTR